MTDISAIVGDIAAEITANADRIEGEARVWVRNDPGPFGIAVLTADGELHRAGAADTRFPLQSIAKVFALELALEAIGDEVFKRVGREPSGDPFNSMVDLERNWGIPRNPFINAGALIVVDILVDLLDDDEQASAVVEFVRDQTGLAEVPLNADVLATGRDAGDLNRAMMSFARHHNNLKSDIDAVMEAYVHQCAIELDCAGLAKAGHFLTRTGRTGDETRDAKVQRTRRLLSMMVTSGQYDGSGDFAYRVGLPAKSGVGGGILAIAPQVASIATWSPNLDQQGNSILGVRALEMLAHRADWSIFSR